MPNYVAIKNRSLDERPREKLSRHGKHTLSNAELLGILISSGSRRRSATDVARDILHAANNSLNNLARFGVQDLCRIEGIGPAKAITILSAIELGARRISEEAASLRSVKSSSQAHAYIAHKLADKTHEEFWVILLNRANHIIGDVHISRGGLSHTTVDPKVVFKRVLEQNATGIILCHNHPSGNLKPSQADNVLTQKLVDAGNILDIAVLDHLIVTSSSYYSYVDQNKMPLPSKTCHESVRLSKRTNR
ncbi:MAG: DNA repair protein RadC [Bacteroidia bacterium]|nr:DNA repair protein RadC [Bacteroidia bacterium]